jgi:hypothetical protein
MLSQTIVTRCEELINAHSPLSDKTLFTPKKIEELEAGLLAELRDPIEPRPPSVEELIEAEATRRVEEEVTEMQVLAKVKVLREADPRIDTSAKYAAIEAVKDDGGQDQ